MTRDPMSYGNRGGFADTRLRSLVIRRLKSQAVSIAAASLPTLAWSAARASASGKFLPIHFAVGGAGLMPYVQAWKIRPRLFGDEAGDIASELIAMTLLQQQKRVNRAAKKAVT